jgi:ABC-type sugar transport system permease subunit
MVVAAERSASKKKGHKRERGTTLFVFLCVLPALVLLAIFLYYPIVATFRISQMKPTGLSEEVFVGLDTTENCSRTRNSGWAEARILMGFLEHRDTAAPLFLHRVGITYYSKQNEQYAEGDFLFWQISASASTAMLGKMVFAPNYGILVTIGKVLG